MSSFTVISLGVVRKQPCTRTIGVPLSPEPEVRSHREPRRSVSLRGVVPWVAMLPQVGVLFAYGVFYCRAELLALEIREVVISKVLELQLVGQAVETVGEAGGYHGIGQLPYLADGILEGTVSVYHSFDPFAGCGAKACADSLSNLLSVVGEELHYALGGFVGTEKAVFFVVSAAVDRCAEDIAEGETHVRACRQYAALGAEAGVGIAAEHLIGDRSEYGLGTVGKYYFRLGAPPPR